MSSIESTNLLYVGKNGGCQIIRKIENDGINIKAYLKNGKFFRTSLSNFYQRVYEYYPKYLDITEELKRLIESFGIPVIKEGDKYKIPAVAYEGKRDDVFTGFRSSWKVKPFYNSGLILFKLYNNKTEFIVTAERLKESYRGTWDEYMKNLKPLSKEESGKIFKELGLVK